MTISTIGNYTKLRMSITQLKMTDDITDEFKNKVPVDEFDAARGVEDKRDVKTVCIWGYGRVDGLAIDAI